MDVAYIKQGDKFVFVIEGSTYNVNPDHVNYDEIVDAVKFGDTEDLIDLIDVSSAITEYGGGKVEVVNGNVLYKGAPLHNALTERMLEMLREGFNIDPLVNFLENLMQNPSKRAVDELYLFLEGCSLPITPDGHFLAYKNVGADYKDLHSRTFDNSVGAIVEMDRNGVDDDRDRHCSHGLHFCSLGYLQSFSGAHTMILKINPRDVVSIPSDYNNTKGRTCRYEVVGEHTHANRYYQEAFTGPVVSADRPTSNDSRAVVSYDLDDGLIVDEFANVQAAADEFGVPASYIKRVLNGGRKSTAGFGWAYADSYEEPEFVEDVVTSNEDEDPYANW